jgi:hypothetical protein
MRMTVKHVDAKEVYDKWDREWFTTYAFYNYKDNQPGYVRSNHRNSEAKDAIVRMMKQGYLIRESGRKIEFSQEWRNYVIGIKLKERWRLSGKAMYELSQVLDDPIVLIDQDYADMALVELVGK